MRNSTAQRHSCYKEIKNFTLLELLIVITIIFILVGILLPSLQKAKKITYRIKCTSNEKQISVGTMEYIQDYDQYFFSAFSDSIYWPRRLLFNYIQLPEIFKCPSAKVDPSTWTKAWAIPKAETSSSFSACPYGVNNLYITGSYRYTGDFSYCPPAKLSQVKSPSATIFLGDTHNLVQSWALEAYYTFNDNYTSNALYPRHDSGLVILWVDGHSTYQKTGKINPYQTAPFDGGGSGTIGNPDNYFDRE